jgi:tetratricopeptide (TPR) repeat protein
VAAASVLSGTAEVARMAALLDELDEVMLRSDLDYAGHLGQLPLRASLDLERGDIGAFRRRVGEMETFATSSGLRTSGRLSLAQQAVVAYLAGDFAQAEARNSELLERHGDHPNAVNTWAANSVIFGRDLGRSADVLSMIEAVAHDDAALPAWRAALALLYADVNDLTHARMQYEFLIADDLALLPDDQTLSAALACLAEVAVALDDPAGAGQLADRLAPFSGLVLAQATSNFVVGVADRYLGMLAATRGYPDESDRFFDAALRLDERLESPPLLARTKLCRGRLLLAGGEPERAHGLLADALAIAEPIGMEGISGQARRLLA